VRGKNIKITCRHQGKIPAQIDGDDVMVDLKGVNIEVLSKRLKVVVKP
jgi:diacylglycerol kinase family enzyme